MATKIGYNEQYKINVLYKKLGTYAAVSRELNIGAQTVKKYIIKDFDENVQFKKVTMELIKEDFDKEILINTKNWGELCVLTDEERIEMKELWKELVM